MILDYHQFAYRLFHMIQSNGDLYDIQNLLRKLSPVNLNYLRHEGQSLVHWCCLHNRSDLLKFFVEYGNCNILESNHDGWLPIHIAVYLGHMNIVNYLIQYRKFTSEVYRA